MNTELEQAQHILSAVYDNKKFIERLIGVTKYDWIFEKVHYHGTCRMPVPFNDFDAVICEVLSVRPMEFLDLGHTIGLYVDENKAAEFLLGQAINELKKREILVCHEPIYKLTEYGMQCLSRHQRPDMVEREFDLIFNATGKSIKNAHKIFKVLPSITTNHNGSVADTYELDKIKDVAAEQVPEIHCMERDNILLKINSKNVTVYSTELFVAVFHNFRDNSLRALVFDGTIAKPIDALSQALSSDKNELKLVVDKIVQDNINDVNDDKFNLVYNEEHRNFNEFDHLSKERQKIDRDLTICQQQYDEAIENNESETAAQIQGQIHLNKRYFDALEFEKELFRLFETTNGDIWIVSPWLKKAAEHLIPLIENYIKKGGRVFVCYSKPENWYDQMADEKVLQCFTQLDNQYSNFYIAQSERPFHVKHLFLRNIERPVHYTGSYNILSFSASHYDSYREREIEDNYLIRQETMIKLNWTDETENAFYQYHNIFASYYLKKAEKELYPIIEKIYRKAKYAYDNYGNKLCWKSSAHYYDDGLRRESYPYDDFNYIFTDFEVTPKVFIPQDERKELIAMLQSIRFEYLKPFTHLKSRYILEKNIPLYNQYNENYQKVKECETLIDQHSKFIKLLREMDRLENNPS